jgi:hypothetical protein
MEAFIIYRWAALLAVGLDVAVEEVLLDDRLYSEENDIVNCGWSLSLASS